MVEAEKTFNGGGTFVFNKINCFLFEWVLIELKTDFETPHCQFLPEVSQNCGLNFLRLDL